MLLHNYGDTGSRPRYQQQAFVSLFSPFLLKECRDRKHSLHSLNWWSKLCFTYNWFFFSFPLCTSIFLSTEKTPWFWEIIGFWKGEPQNCPKCALLASPLGSPPFERAAGGKTWAGQPASQRAAQYPSPSAESCLCLLSEGGTLHRSSGWCRGGTTHLNAYQWMGLSVGKGWSANFTFYYNPALFDLLTRYYYFNV